MRLSKRETLRVRLEVQEIAESMGIILSEKDVDHIYAFSEGRKGEVTVEQAKQILIDEVTGNPAKAVRDVFSTLSRVMSR